MSQENVKVVRAFIEAFNRGDMDAAFSNLAPNFEYDGSRALGPDSRGVYGRDEFREFLAEFAEPWESPVRVEPHEFIEVGEQVVVPWTFRAAGRDGIELRARVTITFTILDGAVERACMYQEQQEALEAAGLSE